MGYDGASARCSGAMKPGSGACFFCQMFFMQLYVKVSSVFAPGMVGERTIVHEGKDFALAKQTETVHSKCSKESISGRCVPKKGWYLNGQSFNFLRNNVFLCKELDSFTFLDLCVLGIAAYNLHRLSFLAKQKKL